MAASSKRVRFAADNELESQEPESYSHLGVKRPKLDNDDDEEEDEGAETSKTPKKHTLDSDEEDDADGYDKLDMDKVEGQEDATLEYEGQIKIMPFNMKEDLEEGHFDSDGTFIYDKKQEMIKDAWLDNIEWHKVKDTAGNNWGKTNEEGERDSPIKDDETGLMTICSRLLEILQEKDTIAGILKKLNNEKGLNAAEERKRRWAAKKAGTNIEEDLRSKQVAELTALADSLISLGHMEAYQLDPEKIRELMAKIDPKIDGIGAKEATLDMFAE